MDGFGRTIEVETGTMSGSTPVAVSLVDTRYAACACSPLGKIQQVSQPYAPGATPVWTSYTYDGLGRTVATTAPDNSVSHTSYSGNQTTVTDAAGKTKTFSSDAFGNLTQVTEPDPANLPNGTLTTLYAYDWMGHVATVSMTRAGVAQVRTFQYNDAGLLTSATNPENGTVTYTYNADNTLQVKHDAKGQDTVFSYDTTKRVTMQKRYPAGQASAEDVCQRLTYGYTASSLGWGYYMSANGRPSFVQWGSQSVACVPGAPPTSYQQDYGYDYQTGAQIITRLEVTRNGGTSYLDSWYGYSAFGRPSTVTYPSWNVAAPIQPVFTYGYDGFGRPTGLTESDNSVGWVQGATYDVAGRLAGLSFAKGTTVSGGVTTPVMQPEVRSYNVVGQLTGLSWTGAGSLSYNYTAGANNGQIASVTDAISGETVTYTYDALKRLTKAVSVPNAGSTVSGWTENYGYDGFGNLTSKVLNGGANQLPGVDPYTNRLASAGYDNNGNMTSGLGATLTYDVASRMVSAVEVSGGTEYYGYGADNRRMYKRDSNGNETWTVYGVSGEEVGKYVWSGATGEFVPVLLNVWFGGRLVATQTVTGVNTRTTNAVMQDRLGTNRAGGARFYPYGNEITSTGNDREKFGTYTRDGYTGLDYADQRFYASTYGRFSTVDPSKTSIRPTDPSSWNRYAYTSGDPVGRNDPTGLAECDAFSYGGCAMSEPTICDFDPAGCIDEYTGPLYFGDCASIAAGFSLPGGTNCGYNGAGAIIRVASPLPDCQITSGYGPRNYPIRGENHTGVDISTPGAAYGVTKVGSITDGTVTAVGVGHDGTHYITIRDASNDNYLTYLHIAGSLTVGSQVTAGSALGVMVDDPGEKGAHVHIFGTTDGAFSAARATDRTNITPLLVSADCKPKNAPH